MAEVVRLRVPISALALTGCVQVSGWTPLRRFECERATSTHELDLHCCPCDSVVARRSVVSLAEIEMFFSSLIVVDGSLWLSSSSALLLLSLLLLSQSADKHLFN